MSNLEAQNDLPTRHTHRASAKFCQMEGIAYGGTDYVDPEEAS